MNHPPGTTLRPDIQALRAIAVLLVVFYHAQVPFFTGGFVGVDVFFVISGYLITSSLVREGKARGDINLGAFYARRVRRLLPMSALVVAAVAVICFVLLSPIENSNLAPSVLFSATYLSNIWFAREATDYLAPEVHDNPLLHTWSLSVEEQFYVVWPLLILLAIRGGRAETRPRRIGIAMLATILLSFAATLWVQTFAQPWAFFGAPFRAWEFAVGGLLVVVADSITPRVKPFAPALAMLGLVMVGIAGFTYGSGTPFPGVSALLPVVGTALTLLAGGMAPTGLTKAAEQPLVRWVGDTSYSLYLWHWPLIAIPFVLWGEQSPLSRGLSVLAALGLTYLSYRLVENPLRDLPALKVSVRRSLAFGLVLTVVGAGSALGLRFVAQQALKNPSQQQLANLDAEVTHNREAGCHLSYDEVFQPDCSFGDVESRETVVLFGDSHAGHLFPAMESLADSLGFRLVSLTKSACPSVLVEPSEAELGRPYTECTEWQERMYQRLALENPDLVVISNFREHLGSTDDEISLSDWEDGLRETVERLTAMGTKTLIIGDTPEFRVSVPECLSRAAWHEAPSSDCSVERGVALDDAVREMEASFDAHHPSVRWADLASALCDSTLCHAEVDGVVLYRDNNHLTTKASLALASALAPFVRWGVLPEANVPE